MTRIHIPSAVLLAAVISFGGCARSDRDDFEREIAADAARDTATSTVPDLALLIPDTAKLARVNDVARDPERADFADAELGRRVVSGYRIVRSTRQYAPSLVGNGLSCGNCHLNAGQRERALHFVGIAQRYPELREREARLVTLAEQVVDCARRHLNARDVRVDAPEVGEVVAYIEWLSTGLPGDVPEDDGPSIEPEALMPVARLDTARGADLFAKKCSQCHGLHGQGVDIGIAKPGPLWGSESWTDGGGAARVYTLASFIRHAMPLLNPGAMTDEEAQQIAGYINAHPRPHYQDLRNDYPSGAVPVDAVYYPSARRGSARPASARH